MHQALSMKGQTDMADYISLGDQRRMYITLPPICDQRAIAHILGTLDDKIELNRRMNQTLEAIARALFTSWFVNFDPVRAKAEGRQPEGMDAATAALFPDAFIPSSIGSIPAGWKVQPIGDVVRVVGGSTPSTSRPDYWNGDVAFCTPKDLSNRSSPVLLKTSRHVTASGLATISSGSLPAGTVLMSSRAPIGYLAVSAIEVAINQGMVGMNCDGRLPNHYVLLWARQNMDTIIGNANGTTFLEISKRNFRPIPALVPSQEILERFEQIAAPSFDRIEANERENVILTTVRDTLLPRLLSGELRVPVADALVEAVP